MFDPRLVSVLSWLVSGPSISECVPRRGRFRDLCGEGKPPLSGAVKCGLCYKEDGLYEVWVRCTVFECETQFVKVAGLTEAMVEAVKALAKAYGFPTQYDEEKAEAFKGAVKKVISRAGSLFSSPSPSSGH